MGHRPAKILFRLNLDQVLYLAIPIQCLPRPGFYGNHQDSLESLVLSLLCRRGRWGSHPL